LVSQQLSQFPRLADGSNGESFRRGTRGDRGANRGDSAGEGRESAGGGGAAGGKKRTQEIQW